MADRREHSRNGYDRTVTAAGTPAHRSRRPRRRRPPRPRLRAARAPRARPRPSSELRDGRRRGPRRRPGAGVQDARRERRRADGPGRRPGRPGARSQAPRGWPARGRKATLADPAAAQRATGDVIGGISPLGSRRPLPVVIDASAHATIRRCSCRPAGAASSSSWRRPTWCACAARSRHRIARDHESGMTRRRVAAGILAALPGKHRRQAQTEERRPPRQNPVTCVGCPPGHPPDRPGDPSRFGASSARAVRRRSMRSSPPAAGGTTHRHRVPPRGVPADRRQGSC